jgi:hypothetical protein
MMKYQTHVLILLMSFPLALNAAVHKGDAEKVVNEFKQQMRLGKMDEVRQIKALDLAKKAIKIDPKVALSIFRTSAEVGQLWLISLLLGERGLLKEVDLGAVDEKGYGMIHYVKESLILNKDDDAAKKEILEILQRRLWENIAAKFNINDEDVIAVESFTDLIADASENNPFFLAAIPAPGNNYHFFAAANLVALSLRGDNFENPSNRNPIQQIFIFKYNKEKKSSFPFDFVEIVDTSNDSSMKHFQAKYRK